MSSTYGDSFSAHVSVLTLIQYGLPWCLRLCDTLDCSPPGSSVHGILQARILEWISMPFSRGCSWPRDRTCVSYVSCTAGGLPGKPLCTTHWAEIALNFIAQEDFLITADGGLRNQQRPGEGEPGAITINKWKLAPGKKEQKSQSWN